MKLKINKIPSIRVSLYNNEGEYLGKVNELEFNDILIQVKNNPELGGCYVFYKEHKITIPSNGKLKTQDMYGLFNTKNEQLKILMGF